MSERPVVLITGAARRVGAAIARALAAAGQDIALHCRASQTEAETLAVELQALGARVEILVADLADEAQTLALVPQAVARFGRLDAVVNNASLFAYDAVDDFSRRAMAQHAAVNTAAPIELARALHRHLGETDRRGCVVNLLDQKLWNPNPDYLSYTLSKAALESANTLLAQALAPVLRVCGVAPGVTLVSGPEMTAEGFAQAHRMTPLGRSSTPEDIAHAVRFLIESPAITGTTLLVDGGQHLSAQSRDVLFLTEKK
jgi:NAD(P)-dependent dehydrogenase (short-subunit alcohol dehydrogenase family)